MFKIYTLESETCQIGWIYVIMKHLIFFILGIIHYNVTFFCSDVNY